MTNRQRYSRYVLITGWAMIVSMYLLILVDSGLVDHSRTLGLIILVFFFVGHVIIPISSTIFDGYVGAISSAALGILLIIQNFISPSDSPLNYIIFLLFPYAIITAIVTAIYRKIRLKN